MKNKGFTLVELLGVIVVLAIISLIAVPTIIGVIDKSRKGALQNNGYGLVEAGTLYYAEKQNTKTIRFDIKNNEVVSEEENKLTYKGNIKEGTVLINNKGEVTVCINDGKYAAYKNFKDNKVTVVNNKTCTIPENSNIVYLDNEATIDMNIEDLVARIETLETTVKDQKEEIETLKSEKSNQIDVTNFINNLTSTHNSDMTTMNSRLNSLTSNLDSKTGFFSNRLIKEQVIVPTGESLDYVATENCYIVGYLHGRNSSSDKFLIDGVVVADVYNDSSNIVRSYFLLPLKKGQTLTAKSDSHLATFTVYAMQ